MLFPAQGDLKGYLGALLVPDYKLGDVLTEGMRLQYTYDFRRFYEHTIVVEKVLKSPDEVSPRLRMEKGDDPEVLHGNFTDFDEVE